MCYRPGDSSIVYATTNGSFYRSVNGGETWTQISAGFGGGITRMVIAVSKANPNKVYVVCSNSFRRFNGFYSSSDNGINFTLKATTPNILGYEWNGVDTTGQAEYDLALCVNPLDSNNILVGGINAWRSTDGGANWLCKLHWVGDNGLPEIHADQHIFEINPLNTNVYFGNDGGLYYSTNFGNSVTDISSGLAISQIYKLSQNPINPNSFMNGYQDNGTSIFRNNWSTVIGGDGMECIIDPIDTTYLYGSLYYGDIRRKVGAGNFVGIARNGLNGITEQGAWVTPYALQPLNNNRMIIGYKNIWRSNNVKSSPPTWTRVTNNGGGNIDCIEFSDANPNNVYYYRSGANLFRTTDISLGSPVWDSVSTPININSIESHPTDNNRIFICGQNKVYKSSNRGGVWTDITGNLPNTSMNNIVMDKYSFEGLYVSTDVGMYYRDSTMANWILYNVGFPTGSRLTEAEIYYHPSNSNLSQITAATYGRGTWQSDLYMTQTQPIVNFTASDTAPCTNANVTLNDITSTGSDMVQWTITPGTFSYISGNANSKNPVVKFNANGNYNVTLYAIKYGKGYNTITKNAFIKVGTSVTINLGAPSKNNFCAGDSALISATGAINYLWSSGKFCSDSTAGTTYLKPLVTTTFVVTGYNGTLSCGDTESVTIIVKPAPMINVAGNTTICSLQATTLVAGGLNTYTWSPNISINTTSGNTVMVNPTSNFSYTVSGPGANGCIGSKAVPITVNPRPKILISGNTTICTVGGGTTLTASGAGNYAWTPPTGLNTAFGAVVIANPLNNITYSVVGNQGFCLDTAKVDIKVVASALVTILPDKSSICLGDSTILNLKGCITYTVIPTANTFFKNDSTLVIFPNTNTTYTIEGTITPTCKDTKAQFITVNSKPNLGLSASKININLGDSTQLSATGAKNYTWSPSTGLQLINDSTVTAKPLDTITYKVIGTNIFNCSVEKSITINVIKLSSIRNIKDDIKIYPNPTSAILFVQMKDIAQAEILNLNGKRVIKSTLNIGQNQLDLSSLSLGTYLLKIYTKQLQTIEYKIVKE